MTTAVPYAQISVQLPPISEVSNRMASTALPPRASASDTMRATTSSLLVCRFLVMPLSSPPARDLKLAPICEPMFLDRTVSPKTSPRTEVTR